VTEVTSLNLADACARLVEENGRLRHENITLRQQAHSYRALHGRALGRIQQLEAENQELKEKNGELNRRLFGRKSEKFTAQQVAGQEKAPAARGRGQAKGSRGHGRKARLELPQQTQVVKWPGAGPRCEQCGLPYRCDGTAASHQEIVVEIKAHKRVLRRQCYEQACSCPTPGLPQRVTAPAPPRLIPRGLLSLESIVESLLRKFDLWMPLERMVREWRELGVAIGPGTWCGLWQRLAPVLVALAEAIRGAAQQERQFLMDETRWEVFVVVEGKGSHRWWLWVIVTPQAKIYVLAPSRGAEVPKEFFGYQPGSCAVQRPFLMADRWASYKVLVDWLILAFCWSHVRRDFLEGQAAAQEEQIQWAQGWIDRIAQLYQLNEQRLELGRDLQGRPLPAPFIRMDPARMAQPAYLQAQQQLAAAVAAFKQQWEQELAEATLPIRRRKVLVSLQEHWQGLTYFVQYPEIPMDNNGSERAIRSAVIGRNNFYGSGSLWSGQLMAAMLTILQTGRMHGIDRRAYLTDYLQACAEHGRKPPPDLEPWLPWNYHSRPKAQGP
jgi:transposase